VTCRLLPGCNLHWCHLTFARILCSCSVITD